jgi:hypothetical protein
MQVSWKIGAFKAVHYSGAIKKFVPYFLHFCPVRIKQITEDVRNKLLRDCEFNQNRRSKILTSSSGVNEFLPAVLLFIFLFGWG